MSKYRNGIENVKLTHINTYCPIVVIITDLTNDEIVDTLEMDLAKIEDRKWIGRLSFWCVSNKHSIETIAKSDVDLARIGEE